MEFRVAIIEDNSKEMLLLKSYFRRFSEEKKVDFQIDYYGSGETFLGKYRPIYDLVMMDIGLPQINGMDAAMWLRKLDQSTTLVFVTNMAQFAVKGYEVEAYDFILKPVAWPTFQLKMQRIMRKLEIRQGTELVIGHGDTVSRISSNKIKYIEISGHQLIYHTTGGELSAYGNLKQVEEKLDSRVFVRCNSCYLVNLNYVRSIDGYTCNVDGTLLQISRPKRKPFVTAVNDYMGGI